MSVIIDNYETIVRTIVSGIRDGTIISKNTDSLEGLSVKELFHTFVSEFDFVHYKDKVITGLTIDDGILSIPFPNKVVYIDNIYFNGIGDIEINEELSQHMVDNHLYFDITALNIPSQWITDNSVLTLNYVGYNEVFA
jgi:hypothetical protein